jgi:hypothetical protein
VAARKQELDAYVERILGALRREFQPTHPKAIIDAYQTDFGSIRVRIIDPGFARTRFTRRSGPIWKILERNLPEEGIREIGLLMLLTPKEAELSYTNDRFEEARPNGDATPRRP